MPVTLAQAKLNAVDDIDVNVIDEFRKSSFLLDSITFDDVVNPAGGGSTLTYGYQRVVTQPTAQVRAFNAEYTPQETTKVRVTTDLKVFGGAFEIDRVLAKVGAVSEVTFQMEQKIKASRALFHDLAINGDVAVDANQFDGLNKVLAGSTTELGAAAGPPFIDLSTGALMDANKHALVDELETLLGLMDERPTFLACNSRLRGRIVSIARRLGYTTQAEDAFGRTISTYDGIPIIDMGDKPGSSSPIVPIYTVGAVTGMTDLYAVRLGLDGFHGISLAGTDLIDTYLPDFEQPKVVHRGEVEMVAAVALKATKAAAVMRRIKVQ